MASAATAVVSALNRPEILLPLPDLTGASVLVTGSSGFLGQRVVSLLGDHGAVPIECDVDQPIDVLRLSTLPDADYCIHLAAHKYATTAEDAPAAVADLNIRGTANVIDRYGANVVLASTCKAADPMTVYGASKLIAERVALNARAKVVRFVNVIGSSGSVAQIWEDTEGPLTVTPCYRMWMTEDEAVRLMVAALGWESGRYCLDVPEPEPVVEMLRRLHPERAYRFDLPRRGDRLRERLVGEYEWTFPMANGVRRISHPADK